jgi:competence protein ComEC
MGGLGPTALLAGTAAGIFVADAGALAGAASALVAGGGVGLGAVGLVLPSRLRAGCLILGLCLVGAGCGAWRIADASLPSGPGSVQELIGAGDLRLAGTLVEDPRPRGDRQQVVLDDLLVMDADEQTPRQVEGRVLVWLPRSAALVARDRISITTRLEQPEDFDGFAYRAYLARQSIGAIGRTYQVEVADHHLDPIPELLGGLRRALLHGLNATVPEPEAALGAGILLGERAGIAPEVSDAFARAGLTHVVAISGWNIAIVAALVAGMTRPLARHRGGRIAGIGVATGAVAGYVLLTGASPSVVRAALMAGALLLARLGGSRGHAIGALQLAALAMLLAAPMVLWDVGFQLSALATAGLIWFADPIEQRLARWPGLVREPLALTLASQVTSLPVILLNFERLSLVAPLANVAVVPLVPVVMLMSTLAAVIGAVDATVHLPLAGDAARWATGGGAWLYLRLMMVAGQIAAALPFASIEVAGPTWMAVIWYPGLGVLLHRMSRRHPDQAESRTDMPATVAWLRPLPVATATLVLLGAIALATRPDGRLHLAVLDVGQGDAILVESPSGATILIDGGPDPELTMRRLGEELPFWQRRLDVVVLTHPHEDHVAGLVAALDRFEVGMVLDSGRAYDNPTYPRFVAAARSEPGARFALARAGQQLSLDAMTQLTVLFPSQADADASLPDNDINNASVVLLLESGSFSALLTGDAETPVENLLAGRGLLAPVDVLKVGHHGSESGTGPDFLRIVQPRIALISCGIDNDYGHPHQVTLDNLAAVDGLEVYRTDVDGTIRLTVSGDDVEVTHTPSAGDAGSIGPWPFPPATRPRRSFVTSPCRRGSWRTRAGWRGSPVRRRGSSSAAASLLTRSSWSPRRCSTTSTSPRPARAGSRTGSWRRTAWPRWAIRSSDRRSPRTR